MIINCFKYTDENISVVDQELYSIGEDLLKLKFLLQMDMSFIFFEEKMKNNMKNLDELTIKEKEKHESQL